MDNNFCLYARRLRVDASPSYKMLRAVIKIRNSIAKSTSFYQLYSISCMISLFNRLHGHNIYSGGLLDSLSKRREELNSVISS